MLSQATFVGTTGGEFVCLLSVVARLLIFTNTAQPQDSLKNGTNAALQTFMYH